MVRPIGLLLCVRVRPANEPDQEAGAALLTGLHLCCPSAQIIFADGGHEGRPFAEQVHQREGVELWMTQMTPMTSQAIIAILYLPGATRAALIHAKITAHRNR
jgi:hypothetical protein